MKRMLSKFIFGVLVVIPGSLFAQGPTWNCKDPSWLKYGYNTSISGHDPTGTDTREPLGIYSRAVFPTRYVNNLRDPVGYPNAALPAQQWIDYPGVYEDIRQAILANESSAIPGLVDGCGASSVVFDFVGLKSVYNSRLKYVSSPYGGYGVYAPFDIRFVIRHLPNKELVVYSGGIEIEVFKLYGAPVNKAFPNRLYSSAGNGRYILASETFDAPGHCQIKIRDDWGSVTAASCRENWRVENLQLANRNNPSDKYYLSNEGVVSAEATPQFYFFDSISRPDGRITEYAYVKSSDYIERITEKSSAGKIVSTLDLKYDGVGRKARLREVLYNDRVVRGPIEGGEDPCSKANCLKATLGYSNGFLTSISSPFGVVNFSYDERGRMKRLQTRSATTSYPVGTTVFDYNNKNQVVTLTGPIQYGTANPSKTGTSFKLDLAYKILADWASSGQPKNVIEVAQSDTGITSWITSVEQAENVTRVTSWDNLGGGQSIVHAEVFSHAFPIASIRDRNGFTHMWKYTRSGGDLGPLPPPGMEQVSNFLYYLEEESIQGPQQGRTILKSKPVSVGGATTLRDWYVYNPGTSETTLIKYNDNGIKTCQETFLSDGTTTPGQCGTVFDPAKVGSKWTCNGILNGRCINSSFIKGGEKSGGGVYLPESTVEVPDSSFPWLAESVTDSSGRIEVSRMGAKTVTNYYLGSFRTHSEESERDVFGLNSLDFLVPTGSYYLDSYKTKMSGRFGNGDPQSVLFESGHKYVYGQDSNLQLTKSSKFVAANGVEMGSSSVEFNNLGLAKSATWSWGQSTVSTVDLGVDASSAALTGSAPAFPADECDPSDKETAARCATTTLREVCRPVAMPMAAGETGLKYFYWKYVRTGPDCTAPCADGSMNCGVCVMNHTVKGFDITPDKAKEFDANQQPKVEIALKFPVCETFAQDPNQGNCCYLFMCDYQGMNRHNNKYRCKALWGATPEDCPPSGNTDYCVAPTDQSKLPALCRSGANGLCSGGGSLGYSPVGGGGGGSPGGGGVGEPGGPGTGTGFE